MVQSLKLKLGGQQWLNMVPRKVGCHRSPMGGFSFAVCDTLTFPSLAAFYSIRGLRRMRIETKDATTRDLVQLVVSGTSPIAE